MHDLDNIRLGGLLQSNWRKNSVQCYQTMKGMTAKMMKIENIIKTMLEVQYSMTVITQ